MPVEFNEQMDIDEVLDGEDYVGKIKYDAEYALYVNFETAYTENQPPFDPIHEWVQRNWGEISPEVKEEAGWPNISTEKHQEEVAWLIIAAIQKNGIEGIHFAERSIRRGLSEADGIAASYKDEPKPLRAMAEDLIEVMFERSQEIIENEAKDTGELKDSGSYEITEGDES